MGTKSDIGGTKRRQPDQTEKAAHAGARKARQGEDNVIGATSAEGCDEAGGKDRQGRGDGGHSGTVGYGENF
jgi:hypothetical protein